jgi:hypothetical protein
VTPGRSTFLTSNLRQTAVYWGGPQSDGFGGRTFDEAVEISVRWEDKQELFIDATGQEVRSNAVVYVDRDLDMGGYLYLGELDDLDSAEAADPFTLSNAREIRGWGKTPSLKNDISLRKVWL